jgi:hypothetical protein
MGDQTTKLCDYTNVPNAQFIANPTTSPEIKVDSFEVSPGYLILLLKINLPVVLAKMHPCIYMTSMRYVICKSLRMWKMILLS